jgi:hypothetical protein
MQSRRALATLLDEALEHAQTPRVLDLCSGSGETMREVAHELRTTGGRPALELLLSDLYPNLQAAGEINARPGSLDHYLTESVDATCVKLELSGVRTLLCSLHHMPPVRARAILRDAFERRQPICVYEISDNSVPLAVAWLAFPVTMVMVPLVTPWIRPMTLWQLLFTYLIPVLPLAIAWDGTVSNLRTYTDADLEELLDGLRAEDYVWRKGIATGRGRKPYLLGLPVRS